MYNATKIEHLVEYIQEHAGLAKNTLRDKVVKEFSLMKKRSVYYCPDFAIRFSIMNKKRFSNCVLALSSLLRVDDRPFFVCVVKPQENYLLLANTTCLQKVTHTSQDFRVDNIRGTFLGTDILKEVEGIPNEPQHFQELYNLHEQFSLQENLERLVEATNNIVGTKTRVELSEKEIETIYQAPKRAQEFLQSKTYTLLQHDLEKRVQKVQEEIGIASQRDNVNERGRIIEYLITAEEEDSVKKALIEALHTGSKLPSFTTADALGDYEKEFEEYKTATDIKTEILFLNSNPKAYNIDKVLQFLAQEKTVYLLFFVRN